VTSEPWRRGRRLGVDVGKVRIGIAISDPDGILATPLATIQHDEAQWSSYAEGGPVPTDVQELARLVTEHEVVEVVIGLPVTLAGTESFSAAYARSYAQVVAGAVAPVPTLLVDERMSTAVAARRLSERGVRGGRRRAVIDQAAAVEILQGWLDTARRRNA
jgi:putative Holliday junction resolvase